jgi:Tfp pilus assembly protein PilF
MSRFSWQHLLLVLGLALLFHAPSFAQTSAIEGDVKGENGQPLPNAQILIERTDIKGNYKVKTDRRGHYFHGGLPLGIYTISVEIDGKVADKVGNVRTRLGDPTKVAFDLQEVKARAQAAAAGIEVNNDAGRQMSAEQRKQIEEVTKKRAEQLSKNKALNDAFNAGMENLRNKNYDGAIESLNKAAEFDPKQTVVWGNLAEAYSGLAASKPAAEQPPLLAKAAESYQKALELKPDDAATHNNYGLALARSGKYPEAQAELSKAAELDKPNAGKYFFNLGAILVNTGHGDEAYESFKKAVEADPNYADAHYQIGVYLLSKASITPEGKVTPAPGTVEAFQKYLELRPTGPYAESAKGSLQALTGSVETQFSTKPSAPAKKTKK